MNFRYLKKGEHIRMEYSLGKGDPFVIEENGLLIGYIWYSLEGNSMFIEMVEVIKKGQGNARRVIEYIFNYMDVDVISGYAEISNWNSAYKFWSKLGARMEADEEEILSYYYGEQVYFELYKEELTVLENV